MDSPEEYFRQIEEIIGNLTELLRSVGERLDRLEGRVAQVESWYQKIPWLKP